MPAIIVDSARCKHDGLCVSTCPLGILEQSAMSPPSTRAGYESRCIACGHCMAVCPQQALLLEGVSREALVPLDVAKYPSAEALGQLLRGRRSVRRYAPEPVERALIERVLDAVRWAPSGHNTQPLRYSVFAGQERIRQLAGHTIDHFRGLLQSAPEVALRLGAGGLVKAWEAGSDMVLRDTPQLIVAYGPKQHPTLTSSALIALAQAELMAAAVGLATCWAGYLQIAAAGHAPLRAAMGLAETEAVGGALMIGKPSVKYTSIPPRKPLDVRWD
jgi:nitroreductase/NAD-dependent dihydropyrimidine dehydrogenase PreA subunit